MTVSAPASRASAILKTVGFSGGALCLIYTAWVFLATYEAHTEEVISSAILIGLSLLVFILGVAYSLNPDHEKRLRRAWFFIALASLSNLLADLTWTILETFLGLEPGFLLADIFYLAYYPLILAGILYLPLVTLTLQERLRIALDLTIVLTVVLMALWYLILAPMQLNTAGTFSVLLGMAYPAGDLLLLSGVWMILTRVSRRVGRPVITRLALGLLAMVVADLFYAYFEVTGTFYPVAYLNILYIASYCLHLFAILWQIQAPWPAEEDSVSRFASGSQRYLDALPYLAVAAAMILQFYLVTASQHLDLRLRGLMVGVLVLVGLVLLRQYVALRENLILYQEMRHLAQTDSLTGVYNRHYFNEIFSRAVNRSARLQQPLTVMLIDIDGFKRINDTFGHLYGDQVLRQVAELLARSLRAGDQLARFGGDEFVVLLENTPADQAEAVARRLKNAADEELTGRTRLGFSIGCASWKPASTPEGLLEEADRKLYLDKSQSKTIPIAKQTE